MRNPFSQFLIKPLLALAIALPVVSTFNVSSAEAGHKHRRAAIIAGAIIGGAIAYNHYRKRKHYRHHGYYKRPRHGVRHYRHYKHRGYRHRHYRGHGYRYHRGYYVGRFSGNAH